MASRPTSSRLPTGTTANSARRNLFYGHHLIRRPTGTSTAGGTSTTSESTSMPEMRYDDSSDIVMRDQNGDPQVQMPQLLPLEDEQSNGVHEEGMQSEKESTCKFLKGAVEDVKDILELTEAGLEERLLETYKSRSFVPSDKAGSYPLTPNVYGSELMTPC